MTNIPFSCQDADISDQMALLVMLFSASNEADELFAISQVCGISNWRNMHYYHENHSVTSCFGVVDTAHKKYSAMRWIDYGIKCGRCYQLTWITNQMWRSREQGTKITK